MLSTQAPPLISLGSAFTVIALLTFLLSLSLLADLLARRASRRAPSRSLPGPAEGSGNPRRRLRPDPEVFSRN